MPSSRGVSRREMMLGLGAFACLPSMTSAASTPDGGFLPAEADFVLSNATLLNGNGRISKGVGIRVEAGQIVAVGPTIKGGTDLGGDWLFPGFTDSSCNVGMVEVGQEQASRDDRDVGQIRPESRAIDGFHPMSAVIPITRASGITRLFLTPGGGRLVPGQVAMVQSAGATLAEALVQSPVALSVELGQRGEGGSRISSARELRAWFAEIGLPAPVLPSTGDEEPAKEDAVIGLIRGGKIPIRIRAERADDIERALDLAKTFGFRLILEGGAEAWRLAPEIAAAGVPVILSPTLAQPDGFDRLEARYDNSALLDAAGVRLAFASGGAHFARGLRVDVGILQAYGLPYEAAIRGLCCAGTEIHGISNYGRLEPGAHADLVRASGDPLQPRTRILGVWIRGRPCSMANRQTRLADQFRSL
jgi:imidazolonepropionase-like amidohydrolase